ncbi:MAG: methyltransferase domain-containing protein [Paracoccaceae bacterium]
MDEKTDSSADADVNEGRGGKGGKNRQTEKRRKAMLDLAIAWLSKEMDGRYTRQCPLCGYEGPFAPYRERIDSRCPSCDGRSHHRLFKLWLDGEAPIRPDDSLLHFAPEPVLTNLLKGLASGYLSCDLDPERGDITIDITAIALPDASQDVIVCHQVLEHVDDAKALAELFRILKPGGFAVLTTPVEEGWETTYENPEAVSRKQRQLHHGQGDHLRFFGRDLRDRIRGPGFEIEEFVAVEPLVSRHALERGSRLFIARKPTMAVPARASGKSASKPAVR